MNNLRNEIFITAFGKKVRELRKKLGISQEELSLRMEVTVSQVGRVERGEINTTISTAYEISKALEVELEDLFKELSL